jgi:hypothetical protein
MALGWLLVGGSAAAQQPATYEFRLAAGSRNVGVCNRLDAAMSRVHTVTVTGDKAVVKSSGGIDDNLKPAGAGIWRTDFELSRVHLVVVADLSKSPRTLVVTEPREGCRWSGETP